MLPRDVQGSLLQLLRVQGRPYPRQCPALTKCMPFTLKDLDTDHPLLQLAPVGDAPIAVWRRLLGIVPP